MLLLSSHPKSRFSPQIFFYSSSPLPYFAPAISPRHIFLDRHVPRALSLLKATTPPPVAWVHSHPYPSTIVGRLFWQYQRFALRRPKFRCPANLFPFLLDFIWLAAQSLMVTFEWRIAFHSALGLHDTFLFPWTILALTLSDKSHFPDTEFRTSVSDCFF